MGAGPRQRLLESGARPPTPLIFGFIDEQRALGRGGESICAQLTELGLPVAPRTYRAWKTHEAGARDRSDAALFVQTGNEGRPLAEVRYAPQDDRLVAPQRLP